MIPAATLFEPMPIKAVGATLRAARFAPAPDVPARGTCVLLNGQTEFIEKYFEVIDELRGRGFAVATMDWRGQGGSGRMTQDSRKSFVNDFSEYDEDLETLINWIVTPMLGPAKSRWRWPIPWARISCCAAWCGGPAASGPRPVRAHDRHLLSRPAGVPGAGRHPLSDVAREESDWVWGMEGRDPHKVTFATQLATSDPQRFERTQSLLREQPDLRLAGATWGWLAAALRSVDWLKPQAPNITTPLLMVGAGKDRICITPAIKAFAARAPHADYVEIPEAEHEILMERRLSAPNSGRRSTTIWQRENRAPT